MKILLLGLFMGVVSVGAEPHSLTFAVPETEGRIALGVFAPDGRLVRTLVTEASEEDFAVGLNGYITSWDGKANSGESVPTGKYTVRGLLVAAAVRADGVAFHFNDWVTEDPARAFSGIGQVVPGKTLRLIGFRPSEAGPTPEAVMGRWQFDEIEGLIELGSLPPKTEFLGAGPDTVALALGDERDFSLAGWNDDVPTERSGPSGVRAAAFWNDRWVLRTAADEELIVREPDGSKRSMPVPGGVTHLGANNAALAAWNETALWLQTGETFASAPLEKLPKPWDLSLGVGSTYWVAFRSGDAVVVRQYSFEGEPLREMQLADEPAGQVRVFASTLVEEFYLLLQTPRWARQVLRGYRPAASESPDPAAVSSADEPVQVNWEVFLDKTIENSRQFGWVGGKLLADAGDAPKQEELKISLQANALDGAASEVTLTTVSLPSGLWLAARGGLPLLRLTEEKGFRRSVLVPGEAPGSLRVFAGDGVVVAEFLVENLSEMVAIVVAEVEVP